MRSALLVLPALNQVSTFFAITFGGLHVRGLVTMKYKPLRCQTLFDER
jgi:hypothetical protein